MIISSFSLFIFNFTFWNLLYLWNLLWFWNLFNFWFFSFRFLNLLLLWFRVIFLSNVILLFFLLFFCILFLMPSLFLFFIRFRFSQNNHLFIDSFINLKFNIISLDNTEFKHSSNLSLLAFNIFLKTSLLLNFMIFINFSLNLSN